MSCSTGRLIVPRSADVTTANVSDNNMYDNLIDSFAGLLSYVLADPAYDDGSLYTSSENNNTKLVCPIKAYDFTPPERLELVNFTIQKLVKNCIVTEKYQLNRYLKLLKTRLELDWFQQKDCTM